MKPFFYFILLSIFILSACDSNKSEPTDSNSTSNILTGHLDTAQSLVSSCVTCHGKNGDASLDGAPFLAGQH
ncbi:MAG: hypothetical protein OEX19_17520, partial [Gammaproteobacteria bacterium]|nr:hypothetical protein [Gammaproteobacteria bacterium]